jgi:membrane protease YdiL (CAAX protease family)
MQTEIETERPLHSLWRLFGLPLVQIMIGVAIVNVVTFIFRSIAQAILSALAVEHSTFRSPVVFVVRFLTVYYGYALFVRVSEKRKADEIAIDRKSVTQFLSGGAIGVVSVGVVLTVLWMLRFFAVASANESPTVFEDIMFHTFSAFIQDVVFIAILFRILEKSFGTWISMCATSVIFGFEHLLYPGQTVWSAVTQTFEVGILFCSLYVVTRRIWFISGFHFAWNYIQYAVVGFPVMGDSRPLLVTQFSGPVVITGSPVGLEASLLTFVIGTGLGVFFLRKAIVLKEFLQPSWKRIPREWEVSAAGQNLRIM